MATHTSPMHRELLRHRAPMSQIAAAECSAEIGCSSYRLAHWTDGTIMGHTLQDWLTLSLDGWPPSSAFDTRWTHFATVICVSSLSGGGNAPPSLGITPTLGLLHGSSSTQLHVKLHHASMNSARPVEESGTYHGRYDTWTIRAPRTAGRRSQFWALSGICPRIDCAIAQCWRGRRPPDVRERTGGFSPSICGAIQREGHGGRQSRQYASAVRQLLLGLGPPRMMYISQVPNEAKTGQRAHGDVNSPSHDWPHCLFEKTNGFES
ncbi:hypothetical protein B0H10DRAFT_1937990 [Mycena sp. CBHHK59/15]|nr:hypothetical protein B0H10DRAFT_1937990 [Mycena sp. CBHHK59/15]